MRAAHGTWAQRFRVVPALAALWLVGTAAAPGAAPGAPVPPPPAVTAVAGAPGDVTPIAGWAIQSEAKAQQVGNVIAQTTYRPHGWYPVAGDATVMAGLVANGLYPHVFEADHLRRVQVPDANSGRFVVPWWYRAEFTLAPGAADRHVFVRSNGIIGGADIWLNGHVVALRRETRGAYPVRLVDVGPYVHPGVNVLALRVHPADVERDFVQGWVDWNPAPPDNNMGPWRGVDIVTTGPVRLGAPAVTTTLAPDHRHAALTVRVTVRNLESTARKVTVAGEVAGIAIARTLTLGPAATHAVVFSPRTDPALELADPKLWWPVGMGAHPLYRLALTATVDGQVSDRAHASFGIRSVTSRLTPQGYRQFIVNGIPVLIRGAGWAPDMFLRDNPARLRAAFAYIRNLGLNAIRLEGKLENRRFYDLADRDGIMVLAGWECCDKWEAWSGTGGGPWDAADMDIAGASMWSEARLLRNHPSVIAFLIGSDNAPPPAIANMYVDTLHAEDWPDPIISAASDQATAVAGPSGMKMTGPYAWVPPRYWYAHREGGAFGFNAETSAGADIPRLGDVQRMLSPLAQLALWKYPEVRQFHATVSWSPFSSLARFDEALARRYGAPKDLADYVAKAQLANYADVRAQFEAYSARMDAADPATGVIYWMLDNAWPALHWHLFDYYLNPAGAYFGAQKANEPVHIQYAYDDRAVVLVNHTLQPRRNLDAEIRVRDLDGAVRYHRDVHGITLAANHAQRLLVIPPLSGLSSTYFVELVLRDRAGAGVSRNVYWLSTRPDVLDWGKSNWFTTPVTQYADLTALQTLPQATVAAAATTRRSGDAAVTTVTLQVPQASRALAFFQHVSIRGPDGRPLVPVLWSGNDVTLWPGETVTLTARYRLPPGAAPEVELSGWNVATTRVPVAMADRAGSGRAAADGP